MLFWNAVLKMTGTELELISDIAKRMRRGISYIAKRRSKANNKYIKGYDSGEESKYILYRDANNLCGYAN